MRYGGYILALLIVFVNVEFYRLFFDYFNALGGWISVAAIVGFPVVSLIGLSKASNEIDKIFPAVELQTGALHMQQQRSKRKQLQGWAVTLIIPLLLALIYDLLKNLE